MSAPLPKTSGAPVAQTKCATGEFPQRINPAAHSRATAPLPVAQAQQAGFFQEGETRANSAMPQRSKNGGVKMKNERAELVIYSNTETWFEVYRWTSENREAGVRITTCESYEDAFAAAEDDAKTNGGKVVAA